LRAGAPREPPELDGRRAGSGGQELRGQELRGQELRAGDLGRVLRGGRAGA